MKVLFCTDGSKISFNALKNFSRFINKDTVVDTICVIDWSFLPDNVVIEEAGFANSCRNVADAILENSKLLVEELGLLNGNLIKYCGPAVETILEQLEKENYDFIILGSHGKKGFQRWLGSVSREILDATSIPVYISKDPLTSSKILFATDGSEFSKSVIDFAISNLDLKNCELTVCSVCENPDLLFLEGTLDTNWLLALQKQQETYAEHILNDIEDFLKSNGCIKVKTKILYGTPALSIIDYIKSEKIDLVILGSRIKNRMRNFLLNSICKRVIEHSNCDTLILKNNFNN